MRTILLPLFAVFISTACARQFTSADGSRKVEADFVNYNADKGSVTLKLANGSRLTSSADKFSEKDRAYFIEAQKLADIGRALRVSIKEGDSDRKDDVRGIYTFEVDPVNFAFEVRNVSNSNFEDLSLNYWVVVERDKSEEKKPEIIKGSQNISEIAGRAKLILNGPEVLLTLGCSTSESCPKCQAHAASFGRDRIVGTKIELRDGEGRILVSEASSNRVENIMRDLIIEGMTE